MTYITLNVITTGLSDIENLKIKKTEFLVYFDMPIDFKKGHFKLELESNIMCGTVQTRWQMNKVSAQSGTPEWILA